MLITFISPLGFKTFKLAYMLDSLVRVSRRAEWKFLINVKSTVLI